MSISDIIPRDVIIYIINFLNPKELLSLRATSKIFKNYISNPEILRESIYNYKRETLIDEINKNYYNVNGMWSFIELVKLSYNKKWYREANSVLELEIRCGDVITLLNEFSLKVGFFITVWLEIMNYIIEWKVNNFYHGYFNIIFQGKNYYDEALLWNKKKITQYSITNFISARSFLNDPYKFSKIVNGHLFYSLGRHLIDTNFADKSPKSWGVDTLDNFVDTYSHELKLDLTDDILINIDNILDEMQNKMI
jgi:hypothetical protein